MKIKSQNFSALVSHSFIRHELDQRSENGRCRFQCWRLDFGDWTVQCRADACTIKKIRSLTDKPLALMLSPVSGSD